jgi:hypothetical protein
MAGFGIFGGIEMKKQAIKSLLVSAHLFTLSAATVVTIVGLIICLPDKSFSSYCEDNPSACYQPSVVYGDDDRTDVYAYQGDTYWVDVATNSVTALVRPGDIDMSDPDNVQLDSPTLQEYFNLCPSERFLSQP